MTAGARSPAPARRGPLLRWCAGPEFDDALRLAAEEAGAAVRAGDDRPGRRADRRRGAGPAGRRRDGHGAHRRSAPTARRASRPATSASSTARSTSAWRWSCRSTAAAPGAWRGRLLIDWGPLPGSYAWVFPKGDLLTVGVIAARGQGERTKAYLRDFVTRLGLDRHRAGARLRAPDPVPHRRRRPCAAATSSSPATRRACSSRGRGRASASPLARGRWPARPPPTATCDGYVSAPCRRPWSRRCGPARRLLDTFSRRPAAVPRAAADPAGLAHVRALLPRRDVLRDVPSSASRVRTALRLLG